MAKNQPVKRFFTNIGKKKKSVILSFLCSRIQESVWAKTLYLFLDKDWFFICFGADFSIGLLRKQEYKKFVYNVVNRYQSQCSKNEKLERSQSKVSLKSDANYSDYEPGFSKYSSGEDDFVTNNNNKWKLELAWLTKALEPALQLCSGLCQQVSPF
ncbi:hypothetical protein ACH5RR_020270 [Cinchona calisaya]|uniref:Uncharacterized protein n=1 Tax=Cinchona calisaya TaxID=153742 RepID=A0ABD2ZE03_9GENT